MHEELCLDVDGAATIRLLDNGWAGPLQQLCARFKAAGRRHQNNGTRTLVRRLKLTRPTTYAHCLRVARYARPMGHAFGFDTARLKQLAQAAMMHDIGKLFVPEAILNRPRRPTRYERFILTLHPSFGALLASYFNLPAELRVRTQHHHERWDGRGYPHRLGGTDIPLMARIVQVADAYDAMVAERPYSRPVRHADAVLELRQHVGKQFDPRVIEAFLDTFQTE
ncbi:MAG TPA: HD domain-containing phosphohydrolase [Pyrinomonadaceae bacterium]|jgi:HD-GYP domain-containing protein (c-di-GMP phosphodiesterase class II)